jgi:hypothetical protein
MGNMTNENVPPVDLTAMVRAFRFAFVCMLLGDCCFDILSTLGIDKFRVLYADMLGGKPLPAITVFILRFQTLFVVLSIGVPVCALATLVSRKLIRSIYILGVLAFFIFTESGLLFYGLIVCPLERMIALIGSPVN